jgi:hypothetical protein
MDPAEEVTMGDDQGVPIRFTDEEAAFLRHVRFGELPDRVLPAEWVELTETEPRRDIPEPAGDPAPWGFRMSAGG